MSLIGQALEKMRRKTAGSFEARPFSDLAAHKLIRQHQKIGAMLGIESPFFRSAEGMQGRKTLIDGKPVLNFAWCDYLGLSQHPELIAAGKAAMDQYGTTVSASRMVSGDTPVHRDLEKEIAEFLARFDVNLHHLLRVRSSQRQHRPWVSRRKPNLAVWDARSQKSPARIAPAGFFFVWHSSHRQHGDRGRL